MVEAPIWKICSSNWIICPGFGVNIKNIWNHLDLRIFNSWPTSWCIPYITCVNNIIYYIYFYWYIRNPNHPCFFIGKCLVLEGWSPKERTNRYHDIYVYIYIEDCIDNKSKLSPLSILHDFFLIMLLCDMYLLPATFEYLRSWTIHPVSDQRTNKYNPSAWYKGSRVWNAGEMVHSWKPKTYIVSQNCIISWHFKLIILTKTPW